MRKIPAFPQVKVGGVTRYHTVGYSTVYEYYAYGREVNKKRPRIAQMVLIQLGICVDNLILHNLNSHGGLPEVY